MTYSFCLSKISTFRLLPGSLGHSVAIMYICNIVTTIFTVIRLVTLYIYIQEPMSCLVFGCSIDLCTLQICTICGEQYGFIHPRAQYGFIHPRVQYGFIHPRVQYGFIHPRVQYGFIHPRVQYSHTTP